MEEMHVGIDDAENSTKHKISLKEMWSGPTHSLSAWISCSPSLKFYDFSFNDFSGNKVFVKNEYK